MNGVKTEQIKNGPKCYVMEKIIMNHRICHDMTLRAMSRNILSPPSKC